MSGGLSAIVGDDYRQFHPDYDRVMREDPLRMPDVTAEAAGKWVQMSVEHANEKGYSALIEGTWRNAQTPLQGAREAKRHGRDVMAVVVATQPEMSRLGTMDRYYRDAMAGRDARWTPPSAHDNTVASLPGSVEAVAMSGDVDSLRVTNRAGDNLFYSDGPPSQERAEGSVAALQEGMSRPLSSEQFRDYKKSVGQLSKAHERLTSHSPAAREAWTHITTHDLPLASSRAAVALARQGVSGGPSGGRQSGTQAPQAKRRGRPTERGPERGR